jgi:hypothetical protein
MKKLFYLAAGTLALAACDRPMPADNEVGNEAAGPAAGPAPEAEVVSPAEGTNPVLAGNGLRLASGDLQFGAARAEAVAALAKAFGKPASETGTNEDCGGGGLAFAQWEDSFYAWFEEDKFAGWEERGTRKTASGLGIGSPRADLTALEDLKVEQSTLGTEFEADGLGGLLDSKASGAKVTALWAGTTCMFR